MDNPYAAPGIDVRQTEYGVASAAPYSVAQIRASFMGFAISYFSFVVTFAALVVLAMVFTREFAKIAATETTGSEAQAQAVVETMQGWVIALGLVSLAWMTAFVVLAVFGSILVYRYWSVMQPFSQRTTPGKAAGFLYIPLFNIYWAFVAFYGLAKDIDTYLDKNRDSLAPRPATGMVLTTVILLAFTIVPIINNFALLVLIVMFFIMKIRLNNSIIGIIQDRSRQQASAAPK